MTIAAPPVAAFPSPSQARRAMVSLALLGFFLSTDVTLTTVLIEPMKRGMALTDLQIGTVQGTAFGLAFGLCSMPMGRLIDRWSRVRLISAGLLVWMLALTATGLATDFAVLIVARVALGVVAALLIPAALSLVADLYPAERRSVATSLFVVGQAAGQAFGILAGGLIFDALVGMSAAHRHLLGGLAPWRALYVGAALIGVPLLLLFLLLEEPARQERQRHATGVAAAMRELWAYRGFLGPLLAAMVFTQITMQAASVWATPVLVRDFGLTPGQFAGWLSAVMLGSGMLGALGGGGLGELGRRRGGRAGVLLPALLAALATVPLSLFALAPSVPIFAGLLALDIFAGAIIATLGAVAITLNIPNEIRGLALGANVFASAVFGTATAPTAIALVSRALGGEGRLAAAIAGVSAPSALVAALFFALAIRAGGAASVKPDR